ncbi:hypothetical protein CF326_g8972 [Tilletia indica]|nr:hypothetical protein CF326_g8972 [Tilletia indica]
MSSSCADAPSSASVSTLSPDGTSVMTSELLATAPGSVIDASVSLLVPSSPSTSTLGPPHVAPRPASIDASALQSTVALPSAAHSESALPLNVAGSPAASRATIYSCASTSPCVPSTSHQAQRKVVFSKSVRTASVAVTRVGSALRRASREIQRVSRTRLVERTMFQLLTVLEQLSAPPSPDPATPCASGAKAAAFSHPHLTASPPSP